MRVTITRGTWNSGQRFGTGELLGRKKLDDLGWHDHLCCLGFLGRACGVTDIDLRNTAFPCQTGANGKWPEPLLDRTDHYRPKTETEMGRQWRWEEVFAEMNDAKGVDAATREAWIAEGFRTVLNVEVEFVGDYPNRCARCDDGGRDTVATTEHNGTPLCEGCRDSLGEAQDATAAEDT